MSVTKGLKTVTVDFKDHVQNLLCILNASNITLINFTLKFDLLAGGISLFPFECWRTTFIC